jgi:hypothetical protein
VGLIYDKQVNRSSSHFSFSFKKLWKTTYQETCYHTVREQLTNLWL